MQLTKYRLYMYADDTILYVAAKATEECQQDMTEDVERAHKLLQNFMCLRNTLTSSSL